jgi:hypothetical protein
MAKYYTQMSLTQSGNITLTAQYYANQRKNLEDKKCIDYISYFGSMGHLKSKKYICFSQSLGKLVQVKGFFKEK